MTTLTDSWIQEVASDIKIPAVSPPVCRHLLPVVEMQIRKIIQQAHKFQKRGKSRCLTVDDINLALSLNGLEEIYGLCPPTASVISSDIPSVSTVINLLDFAKQPIPKCPLLPEFSLHWVAVDGYQPLIAENPSSATVTAPDGSTANQPLSLPKEIQHFYYRTTGLILACDHATLPPILEALHSDIGLQELVPYFSQFIYQQIRANTRSLPVLKALIGTTSALLSNKTIHMEFHLQQLLPAIFTCIVAGKLSTSPGEDHWILRSTAAQVVASACRKYSVLFPDLQARVCKTYVDALILSLNTTSKGKDNKEKDVEKQTSVLGTMYGGIVGIQALGHTAIRSLLLPKVQLLLEKLSSLNNKLMSGKESPADRCLSALVHTLGMYMISRLRIPVALKRGNSGLLGPTPVPIPVPVQKGANKRQKLSDETQVSGLEECLVPYYASACQELDYCRLFI
mmetsp:Transcript_2881/g.3014  ORF Transcript_2881/g.3014 Transcript_2881/m.3014 type:complete len:454 (+) Transcript_2881:205-1566(+)